MTNAWQFIPNSIWSESRNRDDAEAWGTAQRQRIAQEWGDRQREQLRQQPQYLSFSEIGRGVGDALGNIGQGIGNALGGIGEAIGEAEEGIEQNPRWSFINDQGPTGFMPIDAVGKALGVVGATTEEGEQHMAEPAAAVIQPYAALQGVDAPAEAQKAYESAGGGLAGIGAYKQKLTDIYQQVTPEEEKWRAGFLNPVGMIGPGEVGEVIGAAKAVRPAAKMLAREVAPKLGEAAGALGRAGERIGPFSVESRAINLPTWNRTRPDPNDFDALLDHYAALEDRIKDVNQYLYEVGVERELRGETGLIRPKNKFVGWSDEDVLAFAERPDVQRNPYQPDWWDSLDSDQLREAALTKGIARKGEKLKKEATEFSNYEDELAALQRESELVQSQLERHMAGELPVADAPITQAEELSAPRPSFVFDTKSKSLARVVNWTPEGNPVVAYPGKSGGIKAGTAKQGGGLPYEYALEGKWREATADDFAKAIKPGGSAKMLDLRRWRDEFAPASKPVAEPVQQAATKKPARMTANYPGGATQEGLFSAAEVRPQFKSGPIQGGVVSEADLLGRPQFTSAEEQALWEAQQAREAAIAAGQQDMFAPPVEQPQTLAESILAGARGEASDSVSGVPAIIDRGPISLVPTRRAQSGQIQELGRRLSPQLESQRQRFLSAAKGGEAGARPRTQATKEPERLGAFQASSAGIGEGGPPSIVPPRGSSASFGDDFVPGSGSGSGYDSGSGSRYEDISKLGGIREFWDRARNVIATQGDAGKEIATRLQQWRDDAEKAAGSLVERMPVTRSLSKTEFDNFVDVAEGKAAPINQRVSDAALEWSRTRETIYKIADDLGAVVGYRADYFPHVYDDAMFKGDRLKKAIDHLIKTGQAKDYTDAMKKLNDFRKYVRADRRHGNLENPRTLDLPDYERTKDVLFGYIESATDRLAQVKNFGKRDAEIERLIGKIAEEGGADETVQHLFDIAVKQEEYGTKQEAISRFARIFNIVTKMGLGAISNASQSLNTATVTGALRTAMAAPKAAFSQEAKDFALKAGVTLDGVIKDLREGAGWEGKLGEVATPGFNQVEKFNRTLAAWAGKGYAEDLAKQLAAGKNVKRATDELTKMGIDPQAVIRRGGRLTEDEQVNAARNIVHRTQFKVDPQDLPGWASSPWGKMVMQFRTFAYNQSAFMAQEVVKPAMQGNIKPLVRFILIGVPLGAGVAELRNFIRQRPSEENPVKQWEQYFQAIGGLGVVGDLITGLWPQNNQYLPAERYATQALSAFLGPSVSTFAEGVGAAAVAAQGKPTSLERFALKQIPIIGPTAKNILLPYKPGGRSAPSGSDMDKYIQKMKSGAGSSGSNMDKYIQRMK